MDNSLRSAALHALVGAEKEAREKALPQLDEAKTILYEFVRAYGNLSVPGEAQSNATLAEAARMAVDVAVHQINQLKAQRANRGGEGELVLLRAENARLREQQNGPISALQTPAAHPPATDLAVDSMVEPVLVRTEAAPIEDGSLEERILSLAATMQAMRMTSLIGQCVEKLGVDRASAEEGLKSLVSSGAMTVHEASRLTRNGARYAPVFGFSEKGEEALRKRGLAKPIHPVGRLSATEQIWLEEMPLLAHFVEEVLPRHGYNLIQYAPEIAFTGPSGAHTFIAHALLSLNETPVYLLYLGEKYKKGDIYPMYDDLYRLTKGEMYFLCLNPRTVRTLESDVTFLLSGKTGSRANMHIANIDDLALYDEQVAAGQMRVTSDSIWFGAIRRKNA